jgi:Cys-tRNA(Pro)/Cys-tRNA(Cys) deacylase
MAGTGTPIVAVVPVSAQLDVRALATAMGAKKCRMAAVADAERATGYVTGGISPLGHRKPLPVVIDVSVRDFETVFCNADRHHLVRWTITGTRLRCRQCPTCS